MHDRFTVRVTGWMGMAVVALTLAGLPAFCLAEEQPAQDKAKGGPSITFVAKDEAGDAIVEAVDDQRLAAMPQWQLGAESGGPIDAQNKAEAKRIYKNRLRHRAAGFTKAEKATIRGIIEDFHQPIAERYPVFARLNWSFIKLKQEGGVGLPHTRGEHIILPARWAKTLKMAEQGKAPMLPDHFPTQLLLHEQIHVLQRADRSRFEDLYTEVWDFRRVEAIVWPEDATWQPFPNPDTVEHRWIYPLEDKDGKTRWIHPRLATRDSTGRFAGIHQMERVGFELTLKDGGAHLTMDDQGRLKATPLRELAAYRETFPATPSNYHPTELAADYLPIMMMRGCLGHENFKPATAEVTQPLRKWAKKTLGSSE